MLKSHELAVERSDFSGKALRAEKEHVILRKFPSIMETRMNVLRGGGIKKRRSFEFNKKGHFLLAFLPLAFSFRISSNKNERLRNSSPLSSPIVFSSQRHRKILFLFTLFF